MKYSDADMLNWVLSKRVVVTEAKRRDPKQWYVKPSGTVGYEVLAETAKEAVYHVMRINHVQPVRPTINILHLIAKLFDKR